MRRFVSRTMVTPEEISVVSGFAAGAAASSIAGAHQKIRSDCGQRCKLGRLTQLLPKR
jgi:hypothetical protein